VDKSKMGNEAPGINRFKTRPKGTAGALHFFVAPIQKVIDIQSLTSLELKRPSRSEILILMWHGYHHDYFSCCNNRRTLVSLLDK
jgi:hypothetical protein